MERQHEAEAEDESARVEHGGQGHAGELGRDGYGKASGEAQSKEVKEVFPVNECWSQNATRVPPCRAEVSRWAAI